MAEKTSLPIREKTSAVKAPSKARSSSDSYPALLTKTKITVKFDCGFPNQLTIRGQGAGLSWEKGLPLKNVKKDEWVFETEATFTKGEFKVLINDKTYESGANRTLLPGTTTQYTPNF